ncbi:MAG TPA: hypothetical protein DCX07_14165 [Phycisphaerales bacterium]|nr:hypothetical protein [Phycisphaerales bacterium]
MPLPVADILNDIVETIRGTGRFALVTLGECAAATATPRACVTLAGLDELRPDDTADARWFRLRARVTVHARAHEPPGGTIRAAELCDAASALLADPFRGGRCRHLPVGAATEIGFAEPVALRRPEGEMCLAVRCHFQTQDQP